MSEVILEISILEKFMKVKKFHKYKNFRKRKDIAIKLNEIVCAYYNEIPSLGVSCTSNLFLGNELLNRCYSKNNTVYWDSILLEKLLDNFERSIALTFNLEGEFIKEIMNDYNEAFDDRYNYLIDSIYYFYEDYE